MAKLPTHANGDQSVSIFAEHIKSLQAHNDALMAQIAALGATPVGAPAVAPSSLDSSNGAGSASTSPGKAAAAGAVGFGFGSSAAGAAGRSAGDLAAAAAGASTPSQTVPTGAGASAAAVAPGSGSSTSSSASRSAVSSERQVAAGGLSLLGNVLESRLGSQGGGSVPMNTNIGDGGASSSSGAIGAGGVALGDTLASEAGALDAAADAASTSTSSEVAGGAAGPGTKRVRKEASSEAVSASEAGAQPQRQQKTKAKKGGHRSTPTTSSSSSSSRVSSPAPSAAAAASASVLPAISKQKPAGAGHRRDRSRSSSPVTNSVNHGSGLGTPSSPRPALMGAVGSVGTAGYYVPARPPSRINSGGSGGQSPALSGRDGSPAALQRAQEQHLQQQQRQQQMHIFPGSGGGAGPTYQHYGPPPQQSPYAHHFAGGGYPHQHQHQQQQHPMMQMTLPHQHHQQYQQPGPGSGGFGAMIMQGPQPMPGVMRMQGGVSSGGGSGEYRSYQHVHQHDYYGGGGGYPMAPMSAPAAAGSAAASSSNLPYHMMFQHHPQLQQPQMQHVQQPIGPHAVSGAAVDARMHPGRAASNPSSASLIAGAGGQQGVLDTGRLISSQSGVTSADAVASGMPGSVYRIESNSTLVTTSSAQTPTVAGGSLAHGSGDLSSVSPHGQLLHQRQQHQAPEYRGASSNLSAFQPHGGSVWYVDPYSLPFVASPSYLQDYSDDEYADVDAECLEWIVDGKHDEGLNGGSAHRRDAAFDDGINGDAQYRGDNRRWLASSTDMHAFDRRPSSHSKSTASGGQQRYLNPSLEAHSALPSIRATSGAVDARRSSNEHQIHRKGKQQQRRHLQPACQYEGSAAGGQRQPSEYLSYDPTTRSTAHTTATDPLTRTISLRSAHSGSRRGSDNVDGLADCLEAVSFS